MLSIGAASWTELGRSGEFYPKHVMEPRERLLFYSKRFATVEIDSSRYAFIDDKNMRLWVYRTPDEFVFHVLAHNALTVQSVNPGKLPKEILSKLETSEREKNYIYINSLEVLKAVAERFVKSLEFLIMAHKLGQIIFSFPPWFMLNQNSLDHLKMIRELFMGLPIAFEFGHGSWMMKRNIKNLFAFLEKNEITYVTSDQPQFHTIVTAPFVPHVTTGTAYFRLNGPSENWLKKGINHSKRYEYLYQEDELEKMLPEILRLSRESGQTFIIFNNLTSGYAARNCEMLSTLIKRELSED